jgi:hypothetical protein
MAGNLFFLVAPQTSPIQIVPECIHHMPTSKLTHEVINAAILGFEEQKRRIDVQIADLRTMLSGAPAEAAAPSEPSERPRRKVSAAGRRAMALAQKKRWAAKKAESAPATPAAKPKRKMSAAGKAAIVAALKKRWADKKAEAAKAAKK